MVLKEAVLVVLISGNIDKDKQQYVMNTKCALLHLCPPDPKVEFFFVCVSSI